MFGFCVEPHMCLIRRVAVSDAPVGTNGTVRASRTMVLAPLDGPRRGGSWTELGLRLGSAEQRWVGWGGPQGSFHGLEWCNIHCPRAGAAGGWCNGFVTVV
jgi:hypothetical protein